MASGAARLECLCVPPNMKRLTFPTILLVRKLFGRAYYQENGWTFATIKLGGTLSVRNKCIFNL